MTGRLHLTKNKPGYRMHVEVYCGPAIVPDITDIFPIISLITDTPYHGYYKSAKSTF